MFKLSDIFYSYFTWLWYNHASNLRNKDKACTDVYVHNLNINMYIYF